MASSESKQSDIDIDANLAALVEKVAPGEVKQTVELARETTADGVDGPAS